MTIHLVCELWSRKASDRTLWCVLSAVEAVLEQSGIGIRLLLATRKFTPI